MFRIVLASALAGLVVLGLVTVPDDPDDGGTPRGAAPLVGAEPYRPQVHYTPQRNWMNDPNGLVHADGRWHLYYQYNPTGNDWGEMSWGHATSTDLVRWTEQPVALPATPTEMAFSGSAVLDTANTAGFNRDGRTAIVAVYTALDRATGRQAQALAYSLDGGTTFTRYAGNPVLDIGSTEFRDPKVFWDDARGRWVMVVAMAVERKVRVYTSPDLKRWTQRSEFGPLGATGGVWECPDLFPLPVDGDATRQKWVMLVSLNPGSVAGGSGTQYFVGDFDGERFTADDAAPYVPPTGRTLADFEGGAWPAGWIADGDAVGAGPAAGTLPGQQQVSGFTGSGLVNTFRGGDATVGSLTSAPFTVDRRWLNLRVGGGRQPYRTLTGDGSTPPGRVVAGFESGLSGWTATGGLGGAVVRGTLPDQQPVSGWQGAGFVNTYVGGDATTGTLRSPAFTLDAPRMSLLVGGGNHPWDAPGRAAVALVVDGQVVRTATGRDSEELDWVSWDVSPWAGRSAQLVVDDAATGRWGHLLLDQVVLGTVAAQPRSRAAAVTLVVDDRVVASATGADSEHLDWVAWDLSAHQGKQARLQVVDRSTGGWGHVLVDDVVLADTAAVPALERARWLDRGRDNYAGVTWNGAPGGRRVTIGWMSNWDYAGAVPTSPWRSAMTFPRELGLRTVGGRVSLVQQPVAELGSLRRAASASLTARTLAAGETAVAAPGLAPAHEVVVDLVPGTARRTGVVVRRSADGTRGVRIVYDTATARLSVDRTRSGRTDFSASFPSVSSAPLALTNGRLRLRVLVDAGSVEVFTRDGALAITDVVLPDDADRGVALVSEGGQARLDALTVRSLTLAQPSRADRPVITPTPRRGR